MTLNDPKQLGSASVGAAVPATAGTSTAPAAIQMRFIDENIHALAKRIPAPLLGYVPRLKHPTAVAAADFIDLSHVPGWLQARA